MLNSDSKSMYTYIFTYQSAYNIHIVVFHFSFLYYSFLYLYIYLNNIYLVLIQKSFLALFIKYHSFIYYHCLLYHLFI
jgi:hypothetical protein